MKESNKSRVAAARQYVHLKPSQTGVVGNILGQINPQTDPELAVEFIQAIGDSSASDVGPELAKRAESALLQAKGAMISVLLSRPQTIDAYLKAVESGSLQLSDLSLDQKIALSSHPERPIRDRVQKLLAAGGSLPNPDRVKVLEELMPAASKTGDAVAGKEIFKKQCSKCHTHSGEGQKIGPDLTGMAVHPKSELLVHILDPSRSVEGNYRIYTVMKQDGRVLSGMLAGESRTAIEIVDTEAKRHSIAREDIEELKSSNKSLMPEGFEKQVTPDEISHLLEFLTQRGKYTPLPLFKAATVTTTRGMFNDLTALNETMKFADWNPKTFENVPFQLIDPQGNRVANAIMLYGKNGKVPPTMPKSVEVPCNGVVKSLHLLSGVSGWGYPATNNKLTTLVIKWHYANGTSDETELQNGEHFSDYIRKVDVPGSQHAFNLEQGHQIRYLKVSPPKNIPVARIEFAKGPCPSAPIIMAATVESDSGH